MIEAGHHRLAAGGGHRLDDARIIRRDPDRSDVGLHRPAPDMDDHRRAVNVGERLSRQASRAHAGGDEDNRIGHRFRLSDIRGARAYTCCQSERKAANQLSERTAPQPLQPTKVPPPMDSENVNRISLAALGSMLFACCWSLSAISSSRRKTRRFPASRCRRRARGRCPPPRPQSRQRSRCRRCSPRPTPRRANNTPRSA